MDLIPFRPNFALFLVALLMVQILSPGESAHGILPSLNSFKNYIENQDCTGFIAMNKSHIALIIQYIYLEFLV